MTDAFKNSLATFVRKHGAFDLQLRIHRDFKSIAEGLANPGDVLGAFLLHRSHGAYLAATRLMTSGQVPETQPSLRACLEYALYALHINRHPGYGELWLKRHDDADSRRAVRGAFQHIAVMETLKHCDATLHGSIETLYERTIDFGAHPNERGVAGSLTLDEVPGRKTFQSHYLHGDDVALDAGMKTTAQVGLGALLLFEKLFSDRFRILGIDLDLMQLRQVM